MTWLAGRVRTLSWTWAALLLLALVIAFVPVPAFTTSAERVIRIESRRFEYAPATVAVNPGDRVTLELSSADVVHGLELDGYDVNVTAEPGQSARVTFVADRPGTFRFRCTATCGSLHPFMIGQLQVGANDLLWRGAALMLLAVVAGGWGLRR
jgi:heme/copper-type cytochrome/quinol oxidase subunit 2